MPLRNKLAVTDGAFDEPAVAGFSDCIAARRASTSIGALCSPVPAA
jgi:hypothetical protein